MVRPLAQGAMGSVYEVVHVESGIPYALKAPHPGGDALELERFRREALSLAKISHAHVVRIHDARLDAVPPYLVQDLLPGGSLHDRIQARGPLPVDEAVSITIKLAQGLAAAHREGLLHRDIKPANVLFDDLGEPRLADFGLVRGSEHSNHLTATGQVLGTPAYMAPEQALGLKAVDQRTDVYGLGALLYTMIRGCAPYRGQLYAVLEAVIKTPPPALRQQRPECPVEVERAVMIAMAKQPDERFASPEEFAAALAGEVELPPPPTRRWALPVAAGLVGLGLVAAVGIGVSRLPPAQTPPAAQDLDPPELELISPAEGSFHWGDEVEVVGLARDDSPDLVVRVEGGGVLKARSGQRFRLPVQLFPDQQTLVVTVTDPDGNHTELRRRIRQPPGWYRATPPAERAPHPLPKGVSIGTGPGEFVNERDGSVLVWVPPASFEMGSNRFPPRRQVTLTEGFFLGKYEVSWRQYREFCQATDHVVPSNEIPLPDRTFEAPLDHPVFGITWEEAVAYCDWAGLRLPTDAQFELGARGPQSYYYPWGDLRPDETRLNLADASTRAFYHSNTPWYDDHQATAPVDAYPAGASPYGCLNMVGNVSEWVVDYWENKPSAADAVDPMGPKSGTSHAIKSGSYKVGIFFNESAMRGVWLSSSPAVGFRVSRRGG